MQDKLIELETKFSFQEDMLRELNDVIINQQKQLDQVLVELGALKSQLSEMTTSEAKVESQEQQNERPPHY
ncbi:MAG: slyX family protein [SAR86 cluster bacterium]|uniref:SlyX family protein n=1 Tax=SAR86 cluster bacterium TaxID=2030880 RepID=A0A2A5AEI0_9GAMM|nr:MAG: slyX family protein [SAR86 cluster bacterium]